MALLSSATVLRLVDSMAILLSQAYQLARARLASGASPVVRLLVQRDQAFTEVDLLRCTGPPFSVPFVWRHNLFIHRHLW
jgi:hypothetical protein